MAGEGVTQIDDGDGSLVGGGPGALGHSIGGGVARPAGTAPGGLLGTLIGRVRTRW
jgi:hypothetical protein